MARRTRGNGREDGSGAAPRARKVRRAGRASTSRTRGAREQRGSASAGRNRRTGTTEVSLDALTAEEGASELERARRTADAMVGDQEPGGTVAVPEHDQVDQWAGALGVKRAPESPVRASADLLDGRDRRRAGRRPAPKL